MFGNILVGYDGSEVSARAFRAAVDLAAAFGGRVRVVSVISVPASPLGNVVPVAFEDEQSWVANGLADLVRSVPEGRCAIETDIVFGAPAAALLDVVADRAIDHIVVGRTGKGRVARALLGSVSREIVDRARVAVSVIP